jgi:hypothetical protein
MQASSDRPPFCPSVSSTDASPADSGSRQRQRRSARLIDAVPSPSTPVPDRKRCDSIDPRPSGRNKHRSQSRNGERFGARQRQPPYPPTSSIEDPPKADSGMGQNCGGHRRARVARLHRRAHVCLFCSVSRIGTRSTAVFWYRRTLAGGNFAFRCFKTDQTNIPVPHAGSKKNFAVAATYRLSRLRPRVNTRGRSRVIARARRGRGRLRASRAGECRNHGAAGVTHRAGSAGR